MGRQIEFPAGGESRVEARSSAWRFEIREISILHSLGAYSFASLVVCALFLACQTNHHCPHARHDYTRPTRASQYQQRTHTPIAAHTYSQHHRNLITRHTAQGLAPTHLPATRHRPPVKTNSSRASSTLATRRQNEALLRSPRVQLLMGRSVNKQLAQVLPLER